MGKRAINAVFAEIDAAKMECSHHLNILTIILTEGGPRPKLTSEEKEDLRTGMEAARVSIEDALTQIDKL